MHENLKYPKIGQLFKKLPVVVKHPAMHVAFGMERATRCSDRIGIWNTSDYKERLGRDIETLLLNSYGSSCLETL